MDYIIPNEPNRLNPSDIDAILGHCTQHNASDITIQTNESVIAEIEGRLHPITRRKITHQEVGNILNEIYGANGTIQLLSGQDLDTHYEFKPDRITRYRYRVNGTACLVDGHPGIQLTLRSIPHLPPSIDDMAIPDDLLAALTPEDGIIYVTGATGSGKSTLLSSIIRNIAEEPESHRKILTYESPIEFTYDDINKPTTVVSQSEIPLHLPDFASGVRNALRRKPRLILVGESRDADTISASLEAALTGHPVYTTLHTNGVPETIRRLVGSFPQEERHGRTIDIIETLRVIVWQKLVPTTDGKRTALREYMIFSENIRNQLLRVDPNHVTQKTRELLYQYGQTMYKDAKEKFDQGIIEQRVLDPIQAAEEYKQSLLKDAQSSSAT